MLRWGQPAAESLAWAWLPLPPPFFLLLPAQHQRAQLKGWYLLIDTVHPLVAISRSPANNTADSPVRTQAALRAGRS